MILTNSGNWLPERARVFLACLLLAGSYAVHGKAFPQNTNGTLVTPLRALSYARLPSSKEIDRYLGQVAERSDFTRLERIGTSSAGKPLHALFISNGSALPAEAGGDGEKLTVLLVAGQHGDEPSGTEALQQAAAELSAGTLRRYLTMMDFILVPNANPDGHDRDSRINGNRANINDGFVLLEQPESLAIAKLLQRYRPHVVLDIHEAAALKPKGLGAQGYLLDFEAQFDAATNQAVPSVLRAFAFGKFLPAIIGNVNARGYRAQRYVSAVMDIDQPITHGRLWLRNLRNYAGVRGALSVLMENRRDPDGDYPTPGNIADRTRKQLTGLYAFLEECHRWRVEILKHVAFARQWNTPASSMVHLAARYAMNPERPQIRLPLRLRENNDPVMRTFQYRSRLVPGEPLVLPKSYFVTAHQKRIGALLDKHAIPYRRLAAPLVSFGIRQQVESVREQPRDHLNSALDLSIRERCQRLHLRPGDLRITPGPQDARLVALLLDPRSLNNIFHSKSYQDLLIAGRDLFIVREANCPARIASHREASLRSGPGI